MGQLGCLADTTPQHKIISYDAPLLEVEAVLGFAEGVAAVGEE